jgi:hypothetical protein
VWTREFAKGIRKLRTTSPGKANPLLDLWQRAPEIAVIARPEELQKLPDEERKEWNEIWELASAKNVD